MRGIGSLACSLALLGSFAAQARAQDTLFFPPPNHIAIRVMRSLPSFDVTGNHVWTVNGTTAAVSLGDLDSAGATAFHHHTREQADVQLAGTAEIKVGDRAEPFPPGSGIVVPADVAYSFTNRGSGTITLLEFHGVPRPDLVPPRPKISFPVAEEAVAVPVGQQLVTRVDVADGKTLAGRTCYMRWRSVTEPIDVHPAATPTELFVYVAMGNALLRAEGRTTALAAGTLLVIPGPLAHARLESVGGAPAALVEIRVTK